MTEKPTYENLEQMIQALKASDLELKQTVEALRDSEEKYRELVENAASIILKWDRSGRILFLNEYGLKFFGYSQQEIIGKPVIGTIVPETEKGGRDLIKLMDDIFENPATYEKNLNENMQKDGSRVWVTWTNRPIRDNAGCVTGMFSVGTDITERKRAEEALHNEKEFTETALNSQLDTFFLFEPDTGRSIRWNRAFNDVTGYTDDEIAGMVAPNSYYSPEDLERAEPFIKDVIDAGIGTIELELICKDGRKVPFEYKVSVIKDELGKPKYLISIGRDITERKRNEKELRRERDFNTTIFNTVELLVIALDREGRIVTFNRACEQCSGYLFDEVKGKAIWEVLILPEERESVKTVFKDLYKTSIPSRHKNYWMSKSGDKRFISWSNYVLKAADGSIEHVIGTGLDVTKHRAMEEEKERLRSQLQQIQKMEAIGTVAGGVAHDLNNILSGIINYPELMLLDIPANSPLKKPLLAIKNSGNKAAAIVQDLLTLARRSVKIDEIVNLQEITEEYLASPEYDRLRSFHPRVAINTEFGNGLLLVKGSAIHLSKTIMNLVYNAAEAMPSGGKIQILLENRYVDHPIGNYERVAEGDYVALTVSDTGIGIEAEDMEHIFEPFYTKKKMGRSGTGLGMAVVWGTVKDHKGYIDIQSKLGEGSRFTIYLPATRVADNMGEKEAFTLERYKGKEECVLVVDDVALQREIATSIVKKLGYRSASVSSGEAAIEYLKKNEVDIVLLDMVMEPGINGLETYRRAIDFRPGLKAVIASGYSESDLVREAQWLGAGEYLKKPYTMELLAIAIKKELGRSKNMPDS